MGIIHTWVPFPEPGPPSTNTTSFTGAGPISSGRRRAHASSTFLTKASGRRMARASQLNSSTGYSGIERQNK